MEIVDESCMFVPERGNVAAANSAQTAHKQCKPLPPANHLSRLFALRKTLERMWFLPGTTDCIPYVDQNFNVLAPKSLLAAPLVKPERNLI